MMMLLISNIHTSELIRQRLSLHPRLYLHRLSRVSPESSSPSPFRLIPFLSLPTSNIPITRPPVPYSIHPLYPSCQRAHASPTVSIIPCYFLAFSVVVGQFDSRSVFSFATCYFYFHSLDIADDRHSTTGSFPIEPRVPCSPAETFLGYRLVCASGG